MEGNNLKVTIGIVSWNRKDFLKQLLENIESQSYKNYEIVIVDNGSTDGTVEMIKRDYPQVILLEMNENLGPLRGRNQVLKCFNGDILLSLDSDVEISPDTVEAIVHRFELDKNEELGVVTPVIFNYYTGKIDRTSFPFSEKLINKEFIIGQGGACSFAIKRNVVEKIATLHRCTFSAFGGDELDMCIRVMDMSKKNICLPEYKVYHKLDPQRDVAKFLSEKRDYHTTAAHIGVAWMYYPLIEALRETVRVALLGFGRAIKRKRVINYFKTWMYIFELFNQFIKLRQPVQKEVYRNMVNLNKSASQLSKQESDFAKKIKDETVN